MVDKTITSLNREDSLYNNYSVNSKDNLEPEVINAYDKDYNVLKKS